MIQRYSGILIRLYTVKMDSFYVIVPLETDSGDILWKFSFKHEAYGVLLIKIVNCKTNTSFSGSLKMQWHLENSSNQSLLPPAAFTELGGQRNSNSGAFCEDCFSSVSESERWPPPSTPSNWAMSLRGKEFISVPGLDVFITQRNSDFHFLPPFLPSPQCQTLNQCP